LDYRVACVAGEEGLTREAAEAKVRRLDGDRAAFHRRYWGSDKPPPELFTLTLNVSDMTGEQMVDAILPLVMGRGTSDRPEEARLVPVAA
jgi:hypothetical protein